MTNAKEVDPSLPNECPRGVARDNDRTVSMVPGTSRGAVSILEGVRREVKPGDHRLSRAPLFPPLEIKISTLLNS